MPIGPLSCQSVQLGLRSPSVNHFGQPIRIDAPSRIDDGSRSNSSIEYKAVAEAGVDLWPRREQHSWTADVCSDALSIEPKDLGPEIEKEHQRPADDPEDSQKLDRTCDEATGECGRDTSSHYCDVREAVGQGAAPTPLHPAAILETEAQLLEDLVVGGYAPMIGEALAWEIMSSGESMSDAKRRVVDLLKRTSPATTIAVAEYLGSTDVAARQHLQALEENGLVTSVAAAPTGRGRPKALWSLTPLAMELFPDRHSDLTVELIEAIRESAGDEGLERIVDIRTNAQRRTLAAVMPGDDAPIGERLRALAEQRSREGYMAEVVEPDDDSDGLLLVEHHCPICVAATACQGFCRAELELFEEALGSDVSVEREQHLLNGDTRCVYRVRTTSSAPTS